MAASFRERLIQRETAQLWDNSFVSVRNRFVYVATPKAACTSMKKLVADLEGEEDIERSNRGGWEIDPELLLHGRGPGVWKTPSLLALPDEQLEYFLKSSDVLRFAIVRNPFTRAFSAWQSKVLLREPLQVRPLIGKDFYEAEISTFSDLRRAFEGFLDYIYQAEWPNIENPHWAGQCSLLIPDRISYTHIGKVESLATTVSILTSHVERYHRQVSKPEKSNEALVPFDSSYLTPRAEELIRLLYRDDFTAFGYPTSPPPSSRGAKPGATSRGFRAIKMLRGRHHRFTEIHEILDSSRYEVAGLTSFMDTLKSSVAERDGRIDELRREILRTQVNSQVLADREGQITSLGQAMAERDSQITGLVQGVAERDGRIAGLRQAVAERDSQITGFNQALAERDGRITGLVQAVAERDGQVTGLNQAIAERDGQIAGLNQAIVERDGCIAGLNQAAAEREGQIISLSQAVAQRDGQITGIKRAMAERDGRIAGLSQAVAERDGQIISLNQAAAERDIQIISLGQDAAERERQIASLSHAVAEGDEQIASLRGEADRIVSEKDEEIHNVRQQLNQILQSRSWRATAPVRKVVVTIRRGVRAMFLKRRMSFLRKIAESLRIRRDVILWSGIRHLRRSSLFDAEYYLASNHDVRNAGVDPAKHYLLHGWRELRNPSAAFSTSQYLSANPDVARARINPLVHYLRHGHREGRPIGLKRSAPGRTSGSTSAPFASEPRQDLSVDFRPRTEAPDNLSDEQKQVSDAALCAEVKTIRGSGLFDEVYYRSTYLDLSPTPLDLIRHYCEYGWREGKNPSDDFDTQFYLATYGDIRNAGMNPFYHYVIAGASECRQTLPESGTRHENEIWFGVVDTDIKLIAFYAAPDWATVRRGRPLFKGHRQPLLPDEEVGYYDPLNCQVLRRQVQLAKRHGIYGFCFELSIGPDDSGASLPVENFVDHDDIDFRFCVRAKPSSEDIPEALVTALARAISDRRYIRIADQPVVLVVIPFPERHAATLLSHLRGRLVDQGVGSPFLIAQRERAGKDIWSDLPEELCDAALDLPGALADDETGDFLPRNKEGVGVIPYLVVASHGVARARKVQASTHPIYHAVSLARDDTAQGSERPLVYTRFHLRDYRRWLDAAITAARDAHPKDRRLVFVNAWNAWNDGLFLEPDRQGGFSRINETTRALLSIPGGLASPKVSVIVPNYNHEPFLRRRLDSIYGQTYRNIEIILLDDCSQDQSRALLDQYAAAYPDITRTLFNDENSGSPFRQWAKGIKAATGDLVWIAESDDFCDERFLETLVRCFDDEAVLLAYSKCIFVDRNSVPTQNVFEIYVRDLECAEKWNDSYVETAHNEVRTALGIKNTIPNASGVLFKRPIEMPLLDDESWLSMAVAGDWIFYLHIIRGGKISYNTGVTNFFRRYEGSTAEVTYKKSVFYREVGMASQTVATLYDVPLETLEQCRDGYRMFYQKMVGRSVEEFALWYDYQSVLRAHENRLPNVIVSIMGFFPGGAEILPIRLANEFKRQGLSVLLLNAAFYPFEDGIRRMLRNDVPIVETSGVEDVKAIIKEFGVEVLNTHQWHIQMYPLQVPDVFANLHAHVASLHGMIENASAFGVTAEQLRKADSGVSTWVYTAEKNLLPFSSAGLYDKSSSRFVKIPNGMQPPDVVPVPRADMSIPKDAFVLCCVSRAIPEKGWAEAISVVERARLLSRRDIRLILVGNGPVYDEYCRVGAPDFVRLVGFSANSVGHYAAADMGLMLTKFKSESFPLTVVDCLFAGRPYIASDVGDIRNMLNTVEGVAGEVIELENWEIPIERAAQVVAAFATDKQKYLKALVLVREAAHRYRIDVVASEYVSLFKRSRGREFPFGKRRPCGVDRNVAG
jgi:glycosyltransferase involved in cell wall biosynthesis